MAPLPLCDDLPTSSPPLLFRLKNALLFLPLQKKGGPGLSSEEGQKKKGEEEGKKVSNPLSLPPSHIKQDKCAKSENI